MIANENDETNERVTPTSVRECVTRRHEKNAETDGTVTSASFTTSTATKTGGNVTSSTATSTGASFTGTIASSTASSTASSLVEDVENVINNVSLPIDTTTTTATSLVTTTSSTESTTTTGSSSVTTTTSSTGSTTTTGSSSVTTTTSSTGSTVNYDKDYLQKVGLQFVNGSSNQEIGFGSTFEIETLLNLTGEANEAITREQKTKLENDDEIKTIEWQGWLFVLIQFETISNFNIQRGARKRRAPGTAENWFDKIKKHLEICKGKNKVIFFTYQTQQSRAGYFTRWRDGGNHFMNYRARFAAMFLMHLRDTDYDIYNKKDYMSQGILKDHKIWFFFLKLLEEEEQQVEEQVEQQDEDEQDEDEQDKQDEQELSEVMDVVQSDDENNACDGCANNEYEENQLGHTCNQKEANDDARLLNDLLGFDPREDNFEHGQNEDENVADIIFEGCESNEIVGDTMFEGCNEIEQVQDGAKLGKRKREYGDNAKKRRRQDKDLAATNIQRMFRGFHERNRFAALKNKRTRQDEDLAATNIQRMFRGFHERNRCFAALKNKDGTLLFDTRIYVLQIGKMEPKVLVLKKGKRNSVKIFEETYFQNGDTCYFLNDSPRKSFTKPKGSGSSLKQKLAKYLRAQKYFKPQLQPHEPHVSCLKKLNQYIKH